MISPLAIIQARVHSERLPRKMLLSVRGFPIIRHAWNAAWEVYDHVVIACPKADEEYFQVAVPQGLVYGWDGPEADVLGRFHACAHEYAMFAETPIARITPDDWPIDPFRERCTLADLDHWNATVTNPYMREHIGLLFPGRIEINTQKDYEDACRIGPMVI